MRSIASVRFPPPAFLNISKEVKDLKRCLMKVREDLKDFANLKRFELYLGGVLKISPDGSEFF